jgi:hypothetical protein
MDQEPTVVDVAAIIRDNKVFARVKGKKFSRCDGRSNLIILNQNPSPKLPPSSSSTTLKKIEEQLVPCNKLAGCNLRSCCNLGYELMGGCYSKTKLKLLLLQCFSPMINNLGGRRGP